MYSNQEETMTNMQIHALLRVTFIYNDGLILIYNDSLPRGQTRTRLGQLCAALWDSQSRPDVIQPGFEPGTVVTPLALRCSAFRLLRHSGALAGSITHLIHSLIAIE